jgi:hypothetical protein
LTYILHASSTWLDVGRDVGFSSTKSMLPGLRLISPRPGRAPIRPRSRRQRGHPLTVVRDAFAAHGGQGMECSGVVITIAGSA